MKIYQNLGVNKPEDANLPAGTTGLPYTIISARRIERGHYGKDLLYLECRESGKEIGLGFGYGLVGENVIEPFIEEMAVDGIEKLVGKEVFAFTSPDHFAVRGIAVKK